MNFRRKAVGKRIGVVEIGSRYVRRMAAIFEPTGVFHADRDAAEQFPHFIDVNHIEQAKVITMWRKVEEFYEALKRARDPCDEIWVYGTELCRRLLEKGDRLPEYVRVFDARQEAIASWAAGFLGAHTRAADFRYTIFDQGGGSAELVSAIWTGTGLSKDEHETFDLGSTRLAKNYTPSDERYVKFARKTLEEYAERIAPYEVKKPSEELVLLGGAATKLAFNIKHKKDENHDYSSYLIDRTRLKIDEIMEYYNYIWKIYQRDPEYARKLVDRRKKDEYEIVMSGAVLMMLLAVKLGHRQVTVSKNSTGYGIGFLIARRLIGGAGKGAAINKKVV
jgi:exopolyphosphatase/pppGpp-phosphohydrolase